MLYCPTFLIQRMFKNISNKNVHCVESNVTLITYVNLVHAAVSFCVYLSVTTLRKKQWLLHICCHVAEVWRCTGMNKNVLCCTRALLHADLFPAVSMKILLRQVRVVHGEDSLWHLKRDHDATANCMCPCCIFRQRIHVLEGCIQDALNTQFWSGFGRKSQSRRQEVHLCGSISCTI